jgi:hypothetical protein
MVPTRRRSANLPTDLHRVLFGQPRVREQPVNHVEAMDLQLERTASHLGPADFRMSAHLLVELLRNGQRHVRHRSIEV